MSLGSGLRGDGREARWRRRRLRQWAAAGLALVAVWSLWATLRPTPPGRRTVVVASRELAVGHRISAGDLHTVSVSWPSAVRMPTTADPAAFLGRSVTSTIGAGEPVTTTRVQPGLATAVGADRAAFSVPVTDASLLTALHPGDLVDLFGGGEQPREVPGARVISVTAAGGDTDTSKAALVVSVPRLQARDLADLLRTSQASGGGVVASLRGRN